MLISIKTIYRLVRILTAYKKRRNNDNRLDYWEYKTEDTIKYLYNMYKKYWWYIEKNWWFEKVLNHHFIYIDWVYNWNELVKYSRDNGIQKQPHKLLRELIGK